MINGALYLPSHPSWLGLWSACSAQYLLGWSGFLNPFVTKPDFARHEPCPISNTQLNSLMDWVTMGCIILSTLFMLFQILFFNTILSYYFSIVVITNLWFDHSLDVNFAIKLILYLYKLSNVRNYNANPVTIDITLYIRYHHV